MATALAERSVLADIFLRAAGAVPAIVSREGGGDAALGENPVGFETFACSSDVDGRTLQVQCGIRMDAIVLRSDRDFATVHINLPVSMQCVVAIGLHFDLAAINVDILFGNKSLARSRDLDRRGLGGIADTDKVRGIDTVIASFDSNVSTSDIDNALAFDNFLAFAVVFFTFVTFKAVALLGGEIQGAAGDLEAALALDGVFFGFDRDVTILDFKVIAALDAVPELALDSQGTRALDVQVVSRIDCRLRSVLRPVDFGKQVVAVAIFDNVGRALHQMEHSFVSIRHKNRSVGTLDGRIIEVDSGIALVFGSRRVYDDLEIGRFAGNVVSTWTSDGSALVFNINTAVVVFDRSRGSRKFQENLGSVQSPSVFVVILVVTGFRTAGNHLARAGNFTARNGIARTRNSMAGKSIAGTRDSRAWDGITGTRSSDFWDYIARTGNFDARNDSVRAGHHIAGNGITRTRNIAARKFSTRRHFHWGEGSVVGAPNRITIFATSYKTKDC